MSIKSIFYPTISLFIIAALLTGCGNNDPTPAPLVAGQVNMSYEINGNTISTTGNIVYDQTTRFLSINSVKSGNIFEIGIYFESFTSITNGSYILNGCRALAFYNSGNLEIFRSMYNGTSTPAVSLTAVNNSSGLSVTGSLPSVQMLGSINGDTVTISNVTFDGIAKEKYNSTPYYIKATVDGQNEIYYTAGQSIYDVFGEDLELMANEGAENRSGPGFSILIGNYPTPFQTGSFDDYSDAINIVYMENDRLDSCNFFDAETQYGNDTCYVNVTNITTSAGGKTIFEGTFSGTAENLYSGETRTFTNGAFKIEL